MPKENFSKFFLKRTQRKFWEVEKLLGSREIFGKVESKRSIQQKNRGRSHGGRQIPEVKKIFRAARSQKKMYLYLSKGFFHMRKFSLFFLKKLRENSLACSKGRFLLKNLEKIPLLDPKENFSKFLC